MSTTLSPKALQIAHLCHETQQLDRKLTELWVIHESPSTFGTHGNKVALDFRETKLICGVLKAQIERRIADIKCELALLTGE